jgi:hypothetical protein
VSDREQAEKVVRAACAEIMEHYDAVQIVATRMVESGFTESFTHGAGNFWARHGLMQYCLTKRDEDHRIESRNEAKDAEDGE